jgi:hypothetical protein
MAGCGGMNPNRMSPDETFALVYDIDGKKLDSLVLSGISYPLDRDGELSGFVLHDAAAGRTEELDGVLSKDDDGWVFTGRSGEMDLELTARITSEAGRLKFHCELTDLTGDDRAIVAGFHLPIDLTGSRFWWDSRRFMEIEPGKSYHRTLPGERGNSRWWVPARSADYLDSPTGGIEAYLRYNLYPLVALQTQGDGGLVVVSTPVTEPRISRTEYDSDDGGLRISFDIGLSKETAKFPSSASFDFDLFGAQVSGNKAVSARATFRTALKRYYDIYPDAFVRRVERGGIWLPFSRTDNIERPGDFGIYFHEGASGVASDDSLGVLTFRYVEPMSNWQTMPKSVPRTYEAAMKFLHSRLDDPRRGKQSRATLSCGTFQEDGKFRMWMRNTPWSDGALFLLNPDPDIPETKESPTNKAHISYTPEDAARRYADTSNGEIDGEYIDSIEGWYNQINYRREHFAYTDFPLVFNPETKQVGIYQAFSNLEFIRYESDDVHSRGKLMMANWTPYSLNHICCLIDAVGSEVGYADKSYWTPEDDTIQLFRRSMVYTKPYLFLMNTHFDTFGHDRVDLYMRQSLFYGFFPSMFSADASNNRYFDDPKIYNRDRGLFVKYIPLIKTLDSAGWEPVTFASTGDDSVYVERFGKADGDELYLTVLNVSSNTKDINLSIDAQGLNWSPPAHGVKEMVLRTVLKPEADSSIRLRLGSWGVAMLRLR